MLLLCCIELDGGENHVCWRRKVCRCKRHGPWFRGWARDLHRSESDTTARWTDVHPTALSEILRRLGRHHRIAIGREGEVRDVTWHTAKARVLACSLACLCLHFIQHAITSVSRMSLALAAHRAVRVSSPRSVLCVTVTVRSKGE